MFRIKTLPEMLDENQKHIKAAFELNDAARDYNDKAAQCRAKGLEKTFVQMLENSAQCLSIANWHLKKSDRLERRIARRIERMRRKYDRPPTKSEN